MPQRPAEAARAGFAAIEVQFPYGQEHVALAQHVQDAGPQTVLVNMPRGNTSRAELGLACLPNRRADFLSAIDETLSAARRLDCKMGHCLAGNMLVFPALLRMPLAL